MNKLDHSISSYTEQESKASIRAALWAIAWGVSVTLGCAAIYYLPGPSLAIGIIALIANMLVGFAAVKAYMRWLTALDERQRKIQLESIAITLGILWITFGGLLVLNTAEIVRIDHHVIAVLTLVAALGMASGSLRMLKDQ